MYLSRMVEWHSKLADVVNASPNSFVCAHDLNDQGAKRFSSFDTFADFSGFYQSQKTKHFYEIIRSEQKSKLYLDLDIPNVTLVTAEQILGNILNELDSFLCTHCDLTSSCKPVVSESHSEIKKSYHIVCRTVVVLDHQQRYLFGQEFSQYLPSHLKEYFDTSVYSRNRCFRLLGSSKFNQNRPLVPRLKHSKKLQDHIVTGSFSGKEDKLCFDTIEIPGNIQVSDTSDNIITLLNAIDPKIWSTRSSWLQIGCAMKNIGMSFEDFDKYSQRAPNYGGTRKLWDSIRNDSTGNRNGIGTLYFYASRSPDFKSSSVSLLTDIQSECITSILQKGTLTHSTCCKLFYDEYPDYYIYSNNTWYVRRDCGRYSQIEVDTETILSSHISRYFELFEKQIIRNAISNENDRKLLLKAKSLTEKYEFKTSIIKELKQYYNEPELLSKLNSKSHLIGFDNGVYDLQQGLFRKATIDDCLSWTVGFDYIDYVSCDTTTINYLENFIFSLFESKDTGIYFLKHIGSLLHGGNKEELIHFWVGNGRNGKGTVDDLLRETLGPYYHVLDDAFFTTSKKNQDEASPAMVALKNVRLTMTTEPEGSTSYLSSKFKRLCGNDPIHCRSLYSNQMQTFVPTFKPVIQTNHLPQFTDVDIGLLQRIRVINFCYTFVKPTEYSPDNKYNKLIDINLKSSLKKMKQEFMALLIKWYKVYCDESLDFPSKEILEVTNSYRSDIDSVQTFVKCATNECSGEHISTVDLLFSYNGWSKEKLSRNTFSQRLKGNFEIGTQKSANGRLMLCLLNRSWNGDFS